MKRIIFTALSAVLLSGCVAWRTSTVEDWAEKGERRIGRGPGAEDAVFLHWHRDFYRQDGGGRVSVGLFPGIGQAWVDGSVNGVGFGNSCWVMPLESIGANCLLLLPTLSSLFVAPFTDAPLSSLGFIGCHRWDIPPLVKKLESGPEETLLVYDEKRAVEVPAASGATGTSPDGTVLFSAYPGFKRLMETVKARGRADVLFDDGKSRRRFTCSKLRADALVYRDVKN